MKIPVRPRRVLNGFAFAAALVVFGASPARASGNGELHSFHCLHGCPMGAPATNDTVVREIYTLSSNDLTKLADWVAYRVTPDTIGSSEGRDWVRDPWLAVDERWRPGTTTQRLRYFTSTAVTKLRSHRFLERRSRGTRTSCPTSRRKPLR